MINWINRLLKFKGEEVVDALNVRAHYRCLVVSRETWKGLDIGDLLEGCTVVEGFYDREEENWVLVTRSDP